MVAQTCLSQDGLRISSKLAEHVRDNGRKTQVEKSTLGRTRRRLRSLGDDDDLHGCCSVLPTIKLLDLGPWHLIF